MGRQFLLGWFFLACIPTILAKTVIAGKILVDGTTKVAETDENYVCMTIDLWPITLCPQKPCVWDASASMFNLNLALPTLIKAVQGFKGLRLRVGGTLQDILIYDVGSFKGNCRPFTSNKTALFEYNKGCLYMERWDELNNFFSTTGAIVTFGLNALLGKRKTIGKQWEGDWNYENAEAFIQYTIDKNYQINSWELGNEMAGSNSIGASITTEQYAKDSRKLREIIDRLYKDSQQKPLLVAPGAFFDSAWYSDFANKTGPGIVDVFTHHMYNMGSGRDPRIINHYFNSTYLSRGAVHVFTQLEYIIKNQAPWSGAWVGESGGASGGGAAFISNTFVDGFWYIDQLGMAALYSTKVYCRQTLVGGHYGILNPQSLTPTPDYYGALLFHRLMGRGVLNVTNNVSPNLRTYAHCSRGRAGVTMLFINLSNQTDFTIEIGNDNKASLVKKRTSKRLLNSNSNPSSSSRRMSQGAPQREEYHLTPSNGLIRSPNVLLNGNVLKTLENGDLPNLTPIYRDSISPINIATWSFVFVVIPDFVAPTCK